MCDTVRIWGRGAGGGEVLSAMRRETKAGARPRRALPAMKRKCGCLPERNGGAIEGYKQGVAGSHWNPRRVILASEWRKDCRGQEGCREAKVKAE